jgi:hypothetical protein
MPQQCLPTSRPATRAARCRRPSRRGGSRDGRFVLVTGPIRDQSSRVSRQSPTCPVHAPFTAGAPRLGDARIVFLATLRTDDHPPAQGRITPLMMPGAPRALRRNQRYGRRVHRHERPGVDLRREQRHRLCTCRTSPPPLFPRRPLRTDDVSCLQIN